MMENITSVQDFNLIINVSAGYAGTKEWVQYATDPKGIPMSTGCTSIQVTDIVPYVENGQIRGILAGMPGAAEYEELVKTELKSRGLMIKSGEATSMMSAQSMAHVVIVLLIIFGNISYYLTRNNKRKGSK